MDRANWNGTLKLLPFLTVSGLISSYVAFLDYPHFAFSLFGVSDTLSQLTTSSVASFLIVSIVLAIRGVISTKKMPSLFRFSSVFTALGFLFAWVLSSYGSTDMPIIIAGAIVGSSLALATITWLEILSSCADRDIIFILSSSFLLSILIILFLQLLEGTSLVVAFALVLCASSIVKNPSVGAPKARALAEAENPREAATGMMGRVWLTLCALLLCVIIATGMLSDAELLNAGSDISTPFVVGTALGFFAGSLTLLFLTRYINENSMRILYFTIPLICVGAQLVVWFFGIEQQASIFTCFVLGLSLSACSIMHIARLSIEIVKGLSPCFVFGVTLAACSGLSLLWHTLWPLLGMPYATAADLTFKVVFLIGAAVQNVMLTFRQPAKDFNANKSLDEACSEFTEQYSLSKRESEIMRYLVQGRSATYIAEIECVSINTVNTHIKRIYKKAQVHNRQELLSLVHSV